MIPAELRELRQWVVWRTEGRDGKPTKVPLSCVGGRVVGRASVTDPKTWTNYATAVKVAVATPDIDGIGFVFHADDPYVGVDLDAVQSAGAGAVHDLIEDSGSYAEHSPSGRGAHIIVRAVLNGSRHRTSRTPWGGSFEVYDRERFFTMTGDVFAGASEIVDAQEWLDAVIAEMLPPKTKTTTTPTTNTISADDAEIIERATKAKNGSKFEALWRGDVNGYASESEADFALAGLLAFWTGPDPARIDSLYRRSGLMRDKWDSSRGDSTYGAQTIARVLEGRTEYFDWSKTRKSKSKGGTPPHDSAPKPPPPDVDGLELLADLRAFITRFMVLPSEAVADTLALYVVHTWALDAATYTPYLHVRSPVKRAGKTRLLEVLELVCRNAVTAGSITAAAVFQTIESSGPTLLIDEIDRVFKAKGSEHAEALVGVLNDGFRSKGRVIRGTQSGEPKTFSTWCPKVLAGIENTTLPDTVADRCIAISLERKLKGDRVERLRGVDDEAAALRERCAAWAHHHVAALSEFRLPTIEAISDRAEDIWEPLCAIAAEVDGGWRERVYKAMLALAGEESGEQPEATTLLEDIREAFGTARTISTETLLKALNAKEESPWGARRRGEGLDARGLARMLHPFKTPEGLSIKPQVVRVGEHTPRGYHSDQFADAFARYLAGSATSATPQPQSQADVADVADVADTQGAGQQQRFPCSCADGGTGDGDQCERCYGRRDAKP